MAKGKRETRIRYTLTGLLDRNRDTASQALQDIEAKAREFGTVESLKATLPATQVDLTSREG